MILLIEDLSIFTELTNRCNFLKGSFILGSELGRQGNRQKVVLHFLLYHASILIFEACKGKNPQFAAFIRKKGKKPNFMNQHYKDI